jgi:hypothetical protein
LGGSDLPFLPPKKGDLFLVPNGIRPVMQRTAIEVNHAFPVLIVFVRLLL